MNHYEFITTLADEFESAYILTGLSVVRRDFGDGTKTGCMLTALAKYINPKLLNNNLVKSVEIVVDYFYLKYESFEREWWEEFARYCMHGYDGIATYPRQWMKRNRDTILDNKVSSKLMGAAVSGLVYRHMKSPSKKEIVIDNSVKSNELNLDKIHCR